jgi:microcin C transport system substrate-binding protein
MYNKKSLYFSKLALLTAAFGALVLSGCTKSANHAKADGTFNMNIIGEPATLNPFSYNDGYAADVFSFVVDSMMTYNIDTYEWQPVLAERFEAAKDGKSFTFYLRKDAKFHNGEPVTTADVKFSYDAIFDDAYMAARMRSYFSSISKIDVIDEHTIKFHTKDTYFGNLQQIALMKILPKSVYGDPEVGPKINRELVGSGPYVLERHEKGKRIVLKRNHNWFGRNVEGLKDQFLFERVVLRFVPGQDLAVQMLEKGDLDYQVLSAESFVERTKSSAWGKNIEKVQAQNDSPTDGYGFLAWNLERKPFDNRNVRIALSHLMNRELINEKFRYGMSDLATGPWYRRSPFADPSVEPIRYDPAKARELLTKEGWTDSNKDGVLDRMVDGKRIDFKFTFTISSGSKDTLKYFTLYKEDLKKQGIEMSINQVEWSSFIKLLDEKNFDAVALSWGGGALDLDPKQIWHSENTMKGGSNFISYKNPEVDRLIDVARLVPEREKRIPLMQEIYRKIAADAPYIFLFNSKYAMYGVNSSIERPKDTFKYAIGQSYWSFKDAQPVPTQLK